jgi:hypothetical protein
MAPRRRIGLCWRATRAPRRWLHGMAGPGATRAALLPTWSPRPSRKPQGGKFWGCGGAAPALFEPRLLTDLSHSRWHVPLLDCPFWAKGAGTRTIWPVERPVLVAKSRTPCEPLQRS